ncbi:MAG TPA: hypothetical protein VG826_16590 [Pirellulales bacterium]|nr:hypothetical protein [Pirellulales bacterium]
MMGNIVEHVAPWLVALGFAVGMVAGWGLGWWRQRRLPPELSPDPGIKFTDAGMALLGLLLGFTFSMSLGRHEQRRAAVVSDSNSIGDFYTCASLLKDPPRGRLQAVIRDYAQRKLSLARGMPSEDTLQQALREMQEMQTEMTAIVDEAIRQDTPIAVSLTNTLNGVTSNNASWLAAYRDRLPWSIVLLLFFAAVAPAFLMGQQQGVSQRPHLTGTLSFFILVTLVSYVTLDLNQPGRGLIQVSHESLARLVASMAN